jgi:5'(3')-deoxyribonucleotidase
MIRKERFSIKIGIDMDNVLENFTECWLSEAGEVISVEGIKSWDIHNYVSCGNKIYDYVNFNMLSQLKPLKDSQRVFKQLQDENFDLYVITASQPKWVPYKSEWLKKYFPFFDQDKLVITGRKSIVNCDLLLDDQPRNLELFPNDVICMDYAWNRDMKRDCLRAKDWNDVYRIIHNIEEENEFYNKPIKQLKAIRKKLVTKVNVVADAKNKIKQIDEVIKRYLEQQ